MAMMMQTHLKTLSGRLVRSAIMSAMVGLLGLSGCGSPGKIFYRPSRVEGVVPVSHVSLAVHEAGGQATVGGQGLLVATSRPADGAAPGATSQPTTQSTTTTRPVMTRQMLDYTQPGSSIRTIEFITIAAALAQGSELIGSGREVSEIGVMSGGAVGDAIGGRPGLSAPQTSATSLITGRPGISEGNGLSFADPINTLFNPRANPATGPIGRCNEVGSTGFNSGGLNACTRNQSRAR